MSIFKSDGFKIAVNGVDITEHCKPVTVTQASDVEPDALVPVPRQVSDWVEYVATEEFVAYIEAVAEWDEATDENTE